MGGLVTRALRVLHVDHSTARSGAEYALFRMLDRSPPWEATLLVPRAPGPGAENVFEPLVERGIPVRHTGPAQRSGASRGGPLLGFAARAAGQTAVIRASREFRAADVVHANTSRSALYAAAACRGTRARLVVHLRDLVDAESLGRTGLRLFTSVALRRADGVIANSQATLDSALPYLPIGVPAEVIPSAAGLVARAADSQPVGSQPVGSQPAGAVRRVGMVARLDPWKGQELLVTAFAAAFAGTGVRLVLAGGAPFGNEMFEVELRRLAQRLGAGEQVDFLGHVDDVAGLIPTFDICVQASTRPEPLGQNVLQYLAAGRPTIAADQGGPAEWIDPGRNGLLFRMGDAEQLAQALRRLSEDDTLRASLGAAAAQTPGLATDDEVTARHYDFFERVASRRRILAISGRS